jgi:hypothetical protein
VTSRHTPYRPPSHESLVQGFSLSCHSPPGPKPDVNPLFQSDASDRVEVEPAIQESLPKAA